MSLFARIAAAVCALVVVGVSMTAVPSGSTRSSERVVVWRPLPSVSRTSNVARAPSGSSALSSDDLPTPL